MEARRLRPGVLRLHGPRVLLYHGVGARAGGDPRYAVTLAQLAGHLEQVRRGGYPVVALAQIWSGGEPGSWPPAVILTFDDGRASDYTHVFPVLQERGLTAEFFLNPGTIGTPGFLTWDQVREMARGGMRFQSHAYDHVYLTLLTSSALQRQVRDSKRRLEDELGAPVAFIGAPYGDYSRSVVEAALFAGYRAVCTSADWPARAGRPTVSRLAVYTHTGARELARLLRGDLGPYLRRAARAALVYPAKQALLRFAPGWLGKEAGEAA